MPAQPTLFATAELESAPIPDEVAPAQPELGTVRAGTGMGRRSRRPKGESGSSPMTAPRAPEASKVLPSALLGDEDERTPAAGVTRPHRGRAPSGPDGATRAAAAVRRHRADLLSTAVLALALLATLVASGGLDLSGAAGEPVPAVSGISAAGD